MKGSLKMKKSLIKKSVYVIVLLAMIAASIYCIPGLIDDYKIHKSVVEQHLNNPIGNSDYYIEMNSTSIATNIVALVTFSILIIVSVYAIYRIIRGAKNEILYAKYSIEDFKAEREQEIKAKEEERKNKQLKTLEEQKKLIEEELDRMKK